MVDLPTVCCMCGDVGFPDKLFRCFKCHHRFQHSYCSNYYRESTEAIKLCDWCQSEERGSGRHGGSSKKTTAAGSDSSSRSEYAGGQRIKQDNRENGTDKGKNPTVSASPRPTTRRYKLLKDVMC